MKTTNENTKRHTLEEVKYALAVECADATEYTAKRAELAERFGWTKGDLDAVRKQMQREARAAAVEDGSAAEEQQAAMARLVDAWDLYYVQPRREWVAGNHAVLFSSSQLADCMDSLGMLKTGENGGFDRFRPGDLVNYITINHPNRVVQATMKRLAGARKGPYSVEGGWIYVTDDPIVLEPEEGPWDELKRMLEGLIGTDERWDRTMNLLAWATRLYRLKLDDPDGAGAMVLPALGIAGGRSLGKTWFASWLLPRLFGGPDDYADMEGAMSGADFNSQIVRGSVALVNDPNAHLSRWQATTVAAQLKKYTADSAITIHEKYKVPVTMRTFRLPVFLCNDDDQSIRGMPEINDLTEGRLIALRAAGSAFVECDAARPENTFGPVWRQRWLSEKIEPLIPHFLQWLTTRSGELETTDDRYGLSGWVQPDLAKDLLEDGAEAALVQFLWDGAFSKSLGRASSLDLSPHGKGETPTPPKPADLKASQVWDLLVAAHTSQGEANRKRLMANKINSAGGLGRAMARLENRFPARVSSRMLNGYRLWNVEPPEGD